MTNYNRKDYRQIGNTVYGISRTGEIVAFDPNVELPPQQGEKFYIYLNGHESWYEREWLIPYAWLNTPQFVDPSTVTYFRLPWKCFLPWRAVFWKPQMYDKTHRLVPSAPYLAISRDGDIIDVRTRKQVPIQWPAKDASSKFLLYPVVSVRPPHAGYTGVLRVHILVANAWLPPESQTSERPFVNHIDGNKLNFHLENLEWCTLSENTRHAVDHGLCGWLVPCKLRNVKTGEIKSFRHLQEATDYLNCSKTVVYVATRNRDRNELLLGEWELRLQGDNRPWAYADKIVEYGKPGARYRYTITDPSGAQHIYYGSEIVKKVYHIFHTPWDHGPISNPDILVREFRRKYSGYEIVCEDLRPVSEIEVKDIKTGKVCLYKNCRAAARGTGIPEGCVSRVLKFKEMRELHGKLFRYKTEQAWPTEWYHPQVKTRRDKSIKITAPVNSDVCGESS